MSVGHGRVGSEWFVLPTPDLCVLGTTQGRVVVTGHLPFRILLAGITQVSSANAVAGTVECVHVLLLLLGHFAHRKAYANIQRDRVTEEAQRVHIPSTQHHTATNLVGVERHECYPDALR